MGLFLTIGLTMRERTGSVYVQGRGRFREHAVNTTVVVRLIFFWREVPALGAPDTSPPSKRTYERKKTNRDWKP